MAGDLLIVSIEENDLNLLKEVGGLLEMTIYHADQDNPTAWKLLDQRLANPDPPQKREDLPPHMYVEIRGNTPIRENTIKLGKTGQMYNLLSKIGRPLSIVTSQAALRDWNSANGQGRLDILDTALKSHRIIIEFYKVGTTHVLKKYPNAKKIDQQ